MTSKYWKGGERRAAKKLGGDRIPCSGVGTLKGDVLHDKFFVECKSRTKLSIYPWFTKAVEQAKHEGKNKIPMLVVHEKNKKRDLVVLDIDDFVKVLRCEWPFVEIGGEKYRACLECDGTNCADPQYVCIVKEGSV